MDTERIEQAINDLRVLAKYGEIMAYQNESIDIAIKALEKQIPKQIDTAGVGLTFCPICSNIPNVHEYCTKCGQHLRY